MKSEKEQVYLSKISAICLESTDYKQMLRDSLQLVLEIFSCDRAWLLYPADPNAKEYTVPIMRCRDDWYAPEGLTLPMDEYTKKVAHTSLENEFPTAFYKNKEPLVPESIVDNFHVQSLLVTSIDPQIDMPWVFGLHQCTHEREWSDRDIDFLKRISGRMRAGLRSLLVLRKMKESEDKYRTMFESSIDAILLLDPQKGFLDCNPAALKMFAVDSKEEFCKLNPVVLSPEHQPDGSLSSDRAKKEIDKAFEDGENLFEWTHKDLGGREFPATVLATPIELDGKTILQGTIRDITDRKQVEEAFRENEAFLNETGRIARIGGWKINLETQELTWTKEVFNLHEVDDNFKPTVEKAINFYDRDSKLVIQKAIDEAIQLEIPFDIELGIITAKNNHLKIRALGNVVKDKKGKAIYVIGTFQDITDRKRAEEELIKAKEKTEESELTFRKLFEDSSDAILLIDQKGVFVECNQAALDLLKMTRKQFIFQPPVNISPEYQPNGRKSEEAAIEMIELAYKNGLHRFDWTCLNSLGEEFIVEVSLMPISVKGETMLHTTWRDITKRKQAEEKLRESEYYNRNLFETSAVGLALCKMDGTLVDVNQAYADIIGYSIEEALKLTYWEITPQKYEQQENIQLESLQTTGRYGPYEKEYFHENGTLITVQLRGSLIEMAGETFIWSSVEDITERKRTEEALRESEERFRALHNASFGGIAIHDKGLILECNNGLSEITGYSTSELIGMNGLLLISDDTRDLVIGNIKSGYGKPYEAVGIRKNGERYPLRLEAKNIPYKGKNVRVVEFRDITERKQAEKALRESQEMFSLFMKHSPIYAFIKEVTPDESRTLQASDNFQQMIGVSASEMIGKTMAELFPAKLAAKMTADDWKVVSDNKAITVDEELNGRHYTTVKFPLHFGDRSLLAGYTIDFTERKQAEEALQKARGYISNIIDSMPSVLIGVDSDSTVTQWNSEAQRSTGLSEEEAVGQPLFQAIPWLTGEMEHVREAMRTKEVRSESRLVRNKDGIMRYHDVTIYPLIADEGVGAVIRIDDVTERVHLENMMVQSEKMSSVAGLAAGMAHEINNPLAAITQGYQNILNRINPENSKNQEAAEKFNLNISDIYNYLDDRKIVTFLDGGRDACLRAAQIVKNMLMFSRKSDSSLSMTNLVELIDHTIELGSTDYDMKKKYDFKFVDIIKEYDDNMHAVNCCQSEIEQVLLNLFKNALQAMEEVGTEGYKPQFHIRLRAEKSYARIEIEDNGPGIPDDIKSRIFEPFFSTKPVGTGTGLGLSVSYMIITQNHNGTFEVESEVGRGSKFTIRLPI